MNLDEFLTFLRNERGRWDAVLALIPTDRMEQPALKGGWSVKDLIAHITWFEREMVNLLHTRSLAGGSILWARPTDERNLAIYTENRDRPLHEVQTESVEVYAEFLALCETLIDGDLTTPARFEMPPDWLPWRIFAENTYEHYRDHAEELRKWLENAGL